VNLYLNRSVTFPKLSTPTDGRSLRRAALAMLSRLKRKRAKQPRRYRWVYHDLISGATTMVVAGPTRSEARGAVKKALKIKRRLPQRIGLLRIGAAI
jgi:hypothetical protein